MNDRPSLPPESGWCDWRPVTQGQFRTALHQLWDYVLGQTNELTKLGEKMAASQADIDAVTAELQDENSTLNTAVAAIQQEITNLQNQGVDVTALQQTVADLGTAVSSAAALVPPVSP